MNLSSHSNSENEIAAEEVPAHHSSLPGNDSSESIVGNGSLWILRGPVLLYVENEQLNAPSSYNSISGSARLEQFGMSLQIFGNQEGSS